METKDAKPKHSSGLELTDLSKEEEKGEAPAETPATTQPVRENVRPPIQGRLRCRALSLLVIICFLVLSVLIGGSIYLIYLYLVKYSSKMRHIVYYSIIYLTISVVVLVYLGRIVYKGFAGEIRKKPYARPVNPKWYFELGINGKYYLWRNFLFENFELSFQLYNYGFYACSMSPGFLISYGALIGAECFGRAFVRKDVDLQIANKQKKLEMTLDFVTDVFVLIYPLCVMWFVSLLPFRDSELTLIITAPFICLILKVLVILPEEVALLVKIDKDRQIEIANGSNGSRSDLRNQRRSSISGAEASVRNAQNKQCPKPLKVMVFAVSLLWGLFFTSLAAIQSVNNLVSSPSLLYKSYCKVNTPSCDNWFAYKDNCFHVRYMTTKDTNEGDRILEEFITSSATKIVETAHLNHTTLLKGKFPTLRRLLLYNPKGEFMPALENWPELVYFSMTHGENMKRIENCCGPTTPAHVIFIEFSPNLILDRVEVPHLQKLLLADVQVNPEKIAAASRLSVLHLRGLNLTRLPSTLDNRIYKELDVSRNQITTMTASATFLIDIRYNKLKDYDKTAKHSYAHGNVVCPKGFDCSAFCHPKCSNKWYYPNKMEDTPDNCRYQCVRFCPMTKVCKRWFSS